MSFLQQATYRKYCASIGSHIRISSAIGVFCGPSYGADGRDLGLISAAVDYFTGRGASIKRKQYERMCLAPRITSDNIRLHRYN